jgi:hypothetical protein
MIRLFYTILFFLLSINIAFAQEGGGNTYDFLNLTNSARIASLGGTNVSLFDYDLNLVFHNPSLLNAEMNNSVVLNYVPYMADVNYGYFGYAKEIGKFGMLSIGIHNINYGDFIRTNAIGEKQGNFSGAEYAFNVAYARQLSPEINMGISVKPVYSKLDIYQSFGLAADFGIHYYKEESKLGFGIVLKNIGSQISSFYETKESMPADLQIGVTKRLAHAPFRFSLTAQNLLKWNLTYISTDKENERGSLLGFEEEEKEVTFGGKALRHLVFGIEFLPTKNFHVDFGYNHRRRKELAYEDRMSTTGFSWGFGLKVYKFHFSYGSARYHLGGTSNHFSVITHLSKW